jgi:hypothetical protein
MRWFRGGSAMRAAALVVPTLLVGVSFGAELQPCVNACRPRIAGCRTECAAQPGGARHRCLKTCRERAGCPAGGAPIRTLAYVENECQTTADGQTMTRQSLRIRRGDCEPVPVVEFRSGRAVPDPDRQCRGYGLGRAGSAVVALPVQRIGVSPDGSTVAFEVTNETLTLPFLAAPSEQEGIWSVRADGTDLRKLGPASRDPTFRQTPTRSSNFPYFAFSPDGRLVAFTDVGPDASGNAAVQVVTLDVATGRRTQVTHLPPVTVPEGSFEVFAPVFIDNHTVGFLSFANPDGLNPDGVFAPFTVRTDGTGLRTFPPLVVVSGSQVIPTFQLTGSTAAAITVELPILSALPPARVGNVHEVFLVGRQHVLQLTKFGRRETLAMFVTRDGRRAFFIASADHPPGNNPEGNCQLFSIDTLGDHIRQLTHFTQGGEASPRGCFFAAPPGCAIGNAVQDHVSGTVVFDSSCDAFHLGALGHEIFAMRPDGTGFRRLTATRGFHEEADGAVFDEQVGQAIIAGVFRVFGRARR